MQQVPYSTLLFHSLRYRVRTNWVNTMRSTLDISHFTRFALFFSLLKLIIYKKLSFQSVIFETPTKFTNSPTNLPSDLVPTYYKIGLLDLLQKCRRSQTGYSLGCIHVLPLPLYIVHLYLCVSLYDISSFRDDEGVQRLRQC